MFQLTEQPHLHILAMFFQMWENSGKNQDHLFKTLLIGLRNGG